MKPEGFPGPLLRRKKKGKPHTTPTFSLSTTMNSSTYLVWCRTALFLWGKKKKVLDNFKFINSSVNKKKPHDIVRFHLIPPVVWDTPKAHGAKPKQCNPMQWQPLCSTLKLSSTKTALVSKARDLCTGCFGKSAHTFIKGQKDSISKCQQSLSETQHFSFSCFHFNLVPVQTVFEGQGGPSNQTATVMVRRME